MQFENASGILQLLQVGYLFFVKELEKTSLQILDKFAFAVDFVSDGGKTANENF